MEHQMQVRCPVGLLFELLVVERRTTEIELKSLEQWPTTKDEGVRARRVRQTEP